MKNIIIKFDEKDKTENLLYEKLIKYKAGKRNYLIIKTLLDNFELTEKTKTEKQLIQIIENLTNVIGTGSIQVQQVKQVQQEIDNKPEPKIQLDTSKIDIQLESKKEKISDVSPFSYLNQIYKNNTEEL